MRRLTESQLLAMVLGLQEQLEDLRNDVNALEARVTTVHTEALRAITQKVGEQR